MKKQHLLGSVRGKNIAMLRQITRPRHDHADPPTSAIGYRLIILESVAGVPGMLGGMFRHFRSLRQPPRGKWPPLA